MKNSYSLFATFLLVFFVQSFYAQSVTISGTVINEKGLPLPGASLMVKGTSVGVISDFDGNFSMEANHVAGKILSVSYIGYKTGEVQLTGEDQIVRVVLIADTDILDEVVIVGSSIAQSRKKLGNAITTVRSPVLVRAAPANITTALRGKVPGAQITQNSGDPAGGFSIRLRGAGTIKGSSEPLYVIDGVVTSNLTTNLTNLNVNAGDARPGQNRMADINPNDIENINILNGAAAAAIYGSRASNGVIVITTKKGRNFEDGPELFFKWTSSVNLIRKKLKLNLTGEEFETITNNALSGRLWPIFGFNPDTGELTPFNYLSTTKFNAKRYDYQNEIFHTGLGIDNYFSIRNGNETIGYSASIGYLSNEGIVKNTKFNRLSTRWNITHKITDWITYDLGVYYANSTSNEKPDGNVFWSPVNAINITNNTFDITRRDINGNLTAVERTRVNPLSIIETFDISQKVNRFIPSLRLHINLIEKLTIDQILGVDTYNQKGHIFIPVYPYENVNPSYFDQGYLGDAEAKVFNWNYDVNVSYDTDITSGLNSRTTAGYSFQAGRLKFDGTQGRNLNASDKPTVTLQTQPVDAKLDIFGFFLQETLAYRDKLFLTLAGRVDGATNFDIKKRANFYPKISGSYVLSKESFWRDNGIINSARLRASYGEAGNLTAIAPYERFGSYSANDFLGSTTLQQNSRLANVDLVPERTKEFETGADLSFFNNSVSLLFTYYRQRIEDVIVSRVLAPSVGGATKTENVGSMENNGMELYARLTPVKTDDLVWNLNFNFSRNRNKVLKTIGGNIVIANVTGAPTVVREGQPLGVFYGTYFARDVNGELILSGPSTTGAPEGVPQRERGDLKTGAPIRDANGQPGGDFLRKVIGDPNPDYILGIGIDLKYKNFSFSMLWEAVQGFDVFDADKRTRQGVGPGRLAERELKGELPRGYIAGIYPIEEFRMEDGSFVKLRELSLEYRFPSLFNGNLQNVKITLIGKNLISFDNFFSYDPETNAGGQSNLLRSVNFGNVPIPMTFALSLSTNF